jgi:L,D-transpeptidase ErfK/SrfK
MYNSHVETLAEMARNGQSVRIVSEPYKVGWRDGELFVEVHEDIYGLAKPGELEQKLAEAVAGRGVTVDWDAVRKAREDVSGVPVRVLTAAPLSAAAGT